MYFIPQFDVPVSTRVTSNELTMSGITGTKTLTLSPSGYASTMSTIQVLKNDVIVTAPITVVNGDKIKVSGISSASTETPTYIAILIADVGYFVFGAVTRAATSTDTVPLAKYSDPLASIAPPYVPQDPNNRMLYLTPSNNAITPIPLGMVIGNNSSDGDPSIFAPDLLGDVVQHVQAGEVVQSLIMEGPFHVSYTPTYAPAENTVTHTLISAPLDNKVHIYNGMTNTPEVSVTIQCPYATAGIGTAVVADYAFWVAQRDINRVSMWKSIGGASPTEQFHFDLTAGCFPTNIAVDNANNAYVTCPGTDQVVKVFADGTTPPVYITFGASSRPVNICMNEFKTHAYVFCANTNTTAVITLATDAVTIVATQKFLSCGIVAANRLYVGSVYNSILGYYPLSSDTAVGAYVSLSTGYRLVQGMTHNLTRTEVYILVQHGDAPTLIAPVDKAPNGLQGVYTHSAAELVGGTVVTYQNLTINGLDVASTFRVPSMATTQMWRNATNNFNSAVFSNGDTLQVRMTVPANNLPVSIPLMFTGGGIMFNIEKDGVVPKPTRVAGYMRGG